MKKYIHLLVMAIGIFILAGCESHGKKYDYNKNQNIYYKGDGVDESTARKLAEYLGKIKYFDGEKSLSVQITKDKDTKDTLNINFVVDESKITDKIEITFLKLGRFISEEVYNGDPVNINFIDSHFGMIKKLGYAKAIVDEEGPGGVQ